MLKPILLKLLGKSESDLGDYQHAQLRAKIERFLKCSPNEARSRSGKWLDQWVNQKGKKRSFLNKPIVLMEGPQPQKLSLVDSEIVIEPEPTKPFGEILKSKK